jgi:hypothetical protein
LKHGNNHIHAVVVHERAELGDDPMLHHLGHRLYKEVREIDVDLGDDLVGEHAQTIEREARGSGPIVGQHCRGLAGGATQPRQTAGGRLAHALVYRMLDQLEQRFV